MDTVDLVLITLAASLLINVGLLLLAWRGWRAALIAQREVVLLVAGWPAARGHGLVIPEQSLCEVE